MRNRKPDSYGIYTSADGRCSAGEWRDGGLDGRGVRTWANGDRYAGYWSDDKPDGYGEMTSADGSKHIGKWRNGELIRETSYTGSDISQNIFLGIVQGHTPEPLLIEYGLGLCECRIPEYDIYLINNSSRSVTLKKLTYFGLRYTCDDVDKPLYDTVELQANDYILCDVLTDPNFSRRFWYLAEVEIDGDIQMLEFLFKKGTGFYGHMLPCVNINGDIIYPHICGENEKAFYEQQIKRYMRHILFGAETDEAEE
jgi:hypothetical protein